MLVSQVILLAVRDAVLHLVKPGEDILLDRSPLEEHRQALLKVVLQLEQQDLQLEEGGRLRLVVQSLNHVGLDVVLVPLQ